MFALISGAGYEQRTSHDVRSLQGALDTYYIVTYIDRGPPGELPRSSGGPADYLQSISRAFMEVLHDFGYGGESPRTPSPRNAGRSRRAPLLATQRVALLGLLTGPLLKGP